MTDSNSKLALVTGGAGFIGSHLARGLLRWGYRVRILDNFQTGKQANIEDVVGDVEILTGTITDATAVERAVAGVDFILHEAALPSVPRSVRDPWASNDVNVNGTLQLLLAARDAGVKRLVYAASSSAYGNTPTLPKIESMPANPLSPYAVAKLAAENYCRAFTQVYGLETVSLRYFNVFGPRQDPLSEYAAVIPRFITAMLEGREVCIYGDGEQSRDFTFVDNVVQGNLKALTAPDAAGETCNLAMGESHTLNHLADVLGEILNITPLIRYEQRRVGDVQHSLADIEKARRILDYEPAVTFRAGLEQTVAYFASLHRERSTA